MSLSINTIAVILNGPPGCGKDTLAKLLARFSTLRGTKFHIHEFKTALYEHTARHFGVDLDAFTKAATDRKTKDEVCFAGLNGLTPRQALIHVSEDIYKPRYGKEYFGHVESAKFKEHVIREGGNLLVVYPDGGFPEEVQVHEADAVIVLRLHREGFDFSKDSRDYIYLPDTENRRSYDVHLTDGMEDLDAIELHGVISEALHSIENNNSQVQDMLPVTQVELRHENAKVPQYMTDGAAAADVTCVRWADKFAGDETVWVEDRRAIINPGSSVVFDTGLGFGVSRGYELCLFSRSGHGVKHGVRLSNAVGIIDSDYRGNLLACLHNDGNCALIIEMGERIGQVQIKPAPQNPFKVVSSLDKTKRGEGGFGHTGN